MDDGGRCRAQIELACVLYGSSVGTKKDGRVKKRGRRRNVMVRNKGCKKVE